MTWTSLREEAEYADHRHPSVVRFVGDPEIDARRRDFTVNALYADPADGRVLDPLGSGLADLAGHRLVMIGEPRRRLAEDPLRILRASRFAAALGFALDSALRTAMADQAGALNTLSAERVFAELTRGFCGRNRGDFLRSLVDLGLAGVVLPEVVPMDGVPQPPQFHPEGDVLTHVCLVLDAVPPGEPALAWAAVLHDVGKPATFERAADRIRFHGHDRLSARLADLVLRRLHAPKELRETVVEVCQDHIRFATLPDMGRSKRERWLRDPRFPAHLAFHRADCLGSHGDLSIFETARRMLAELPPEPPPPLCTGRDVLALGVAPGPLVGEVLERLDRRLDAEPAPDRERALELLREIVADAVKTPDPADDR